MARRWCGLSQPKRGGESRQRGFQSEDDAGVTTKDEWEDRFQVNPALVLQATGLQSVDKRGLCVIVVASKRRRIEGSSSCEEISNRQGECR